MSMVTAVLPVEVHSKHSTEKKKAYPFCRICSELCNAYGIIKSHRFFHTFGVTFIHLVTTFTHNCHITIMTLLASNYDINGSRT